MPLLYGEKLSRREILRRVGDVSQIAGVRRVTLREGREEGVEVALFRTGTGFEFTVLISRGMDISQAEYCGRALAWRSATGDQHPAFFEPEGFGWLRSFYGGLVVTCGLTYAGAPGQDVLNLQGKEIPYEFGLHGRVSNTPAYAVWADGEWQEDDYVFWCQGRVRESMVFGENLVLTRKIIAKLGESKFWIQDVVENWGDTPQPLMLLYHINGGYPAVAPGGSLLAPTQSITPRDAEAEEGKELYAQFQEPTPGYKEKVYYHEMVADDEGKVTTALVNPSFNKGQGFGFYVTYSKEQLPYFTEWKMMREGTYVVGMEPANCHVEGRAKERERGTLQWIQPGESRRFDLEIGVIENQAQIQQIREKHQKLLRA